KGDFLVKLKPNGKRTSAEVINNVRAQFRTALPRFQWEFPGILTDLIGDLTWSDEAIEIKILSTDQKFLTRTSAEVVKQLSFVNGATDIFNGLVYTGPSINLRVKTAEAQRYGFNADSLATAVNIAVHGQVASSVLEADRVVNVRVIASAEATVTLDSLRALPLRTPAGPIVCLNQLVDVTNVPGELELHRDNLREEVAVTANLEGRDLGSAMNDIRQRLSNDSNIPPGTIEYGGLYEQQQQSFNQLATMLAAAVVLVFLVALFEFGSLCEPIAIVFGAITSLFGIMLALFLTKTSLNVITYLGAIIGMGIVHKNGLLMLDSVSHLRATGLGLHDALVQAGRRRLRPVLMTSLAAALGMLPLAWGVGSADMLRPLALAVIGAVCVSVLLSLVATPAVYYILKIGSR
ncbi:MAG: efflux RND transporter permease subunit, partial [Phycisphaerae bacterium]|nr:efflux RND transporter permease subunit [Phycisphaerae bacterium]